MAKFALYAVGYGLDPNTKKPVTGLKVTTWKECEKYVKGVEGAKYKGFLTDTEADAWLKKIGENSVADDDSAQQPVQQSSATVSNAGSGQSAIDEARSKFVDICRSFNINPNDMVNKLIVDFVNMHYFVRSKSAEDGILPFN